MIKRWQKMLNTINRLIELVLIFASYFGSVAFWLLLVRHDTQNIALQLSSAGWYALAYAILIVLLYQLVGLYDSVRAKPIGNEVKWVLGVNAVVTLFGAALLFVFRLSDFSRGVLLSIYVISCLVVMAKRLVVRKVLSYYRSKGFNQKHVILIGSGPLAQKYAETIRRTPRYGYTIDGYIGISKTMPEIPYLGTWEEVGSQSIEQSDVDEVVAALDQANLSLLPQIIAATEKHGTKVSIIPYFNDYIPSSTTIETLGECKLLNVRTIPLDFPANAIVKRAFDILSSLVLIVLTSPIMLAAAIGVKLSSPGPVIFRQTRVGKGKKPFEMYKFRSMRVNAEENTAWTTNNDPRKTRFGSFIRKTSIDELPQFFNVLKGDMSLVGPRPELPHFVEQFKETVPLYMLKHLVRPGITGWAQVNGFRGDTSIAGRVEHDIWYIEHWTMGLDFRICVLTAFGGIVNKEKVHKAE
ncbi:MAG TPA: undecaprenyl-phosphate glucose phosphotransferase [Feifaniaceae bacterium]|nr:undecaprenyl-phosphate glucose phosphotransferase [Feifaniaceae bacterium]